MTRRLLGLPLIYIMLICFMLWARPVVAQTPTVLVLDRHKTPLTALIDGNAVSLQINVSSAFTANTPVDFRLTGTDASIATCTMPAGQKSCQTAEFPALGWAWDDDGVRQTQRLVQAHVAGIALGESTPLAITPRPVVMVHGFSANWESWSAYLGADGYLTANGLQGYAVGDGQVPGVLDTGNKLTPLTPTNTIAQNAEILSQYIGTFNKKLEQSRWIYSSTAWAGSLHAII